MNEVIHGDPASHKLAELIAEIRVAMFTTYGTAGELHSRPMYVLSAEPEGELWFATSRTSSLTADLRVDARSSVTFADPGSQRYVVVRGSAVTMHDPHVITALWSPAMKVWFPGGPEDPELLLVRVAADVAEYWDAPSAPVRWLQFAKALLTGTRPDGGDHATLQLDPSM